MNSMLTPNPTFWSAVTASIIETLKAKNSVTKILNKSTQPGSEQFVRAKKMDMIKSMNSIYKPDVEESRLGPYDILCGRCTAAFNNVGNRRFRVTIALNLDRYMKAPTRHDKTAVVISIVRILKGDVGARFLRKEGDEYVELTDKQAKEKVGHCLRDMVANHQQERRIERPRNKGIRTMEERKKSMKLTLEEEDLFREGLGDLAALCDEISESFEPMPVLRAARSA